MRIEACGAGIKLGVAIVLSWIEGSGLGVIGDSSVVNNCGILSESRGLLVPVGPERRT